ncbi:ADP-ribosyltransferase [Flavobacterium sp. I3-2]|uniref:ADP-ribosyltransferase n=1 Tax=Flavobacterium sp. I3-2 TaxID=2748319 RepID=UPI0015AB7465|nr:ADP-ribosyltransferase [Flavobacterium sp. I3-2]
MVFEKHIDTQYAFDPIAYNKELTSDYKKVNDAFVTFKAVPNGLTDKLWAKITITGTDVVADSIFFKTQNGIKVDAVKEGDHFVLTLKGAQKFALEEVQATIKQGDKYKIAGVFTMVHITPKTLKLNLIPTKGVSISDDKKAEIKAIYKQLAIDVDVSVVNEFDINDLIQDTQKKVIDTEDAFGDLSTYSKEQNTIIDAFKNHPNRTIEQAYYVFVTDKASSTGQSGYMKLNGQFGFVFDQNATTIAHELAHGAFKLEHPFNKFKNKGVNQGTTQSLMDYPPTTEFLFTDWKQINDPAFKLYAFQSQSDGEHNPLGHLGITPNGKIFDQFFLNNDRISVTYLISANYTINSIKYDNITYEWNTSKDAFVNGEVTITTKKIKVTIDNKVNVYQSRNNDKCIYDYTLIEWTSENEKASNTSELIENKLESSSFTGWLPSPYDVRDVSCSNNFSQEILSRDRQPCSLENVTQGLAILETALTKTDGEKVAELVNQVCLSALRELNHNKKEDLITKIASQDRLIEASELAILRLMTAIDSENYQTFFKLLEQNNNQLLKHLIAEIDDVSIYFWKDKENYANFMGALVTMFNSANKNLVNNGVNVNDYDNFSVVQNSYLLPKNNEKIFNIYFQYNSPKLYISQGVWEVTQNCKWTSGFGDSSYEECETTQKIVRQEPVYLKPFDVTVIANDSDFNLIEGLPGVDKEVSVVPAILLYYASSKGENNNIKSYVENTLDVVTLLVPISKVVTGPKWIAKTFTFVEKWGKVNAGANLAIKNSPLNEQPELKGALETYNNVTAIVNITTLAGGVGKNIVARFFKEADNPVVKNLIVAEARNGSEDAQKILDVEAELKAYSKTKLGKDWWKSVVNTISEIDIVKLLKNDDFKKIYNDLKNGVTPRRFLNELTLEQEAVFKFYTNTSYYKFNQALIANSKADDILEIEKLLNQALDKIPSSPGTYYRGIGKDEIAKLAKLKIGEDVSYNNFISTSSEREKALEFYFNNLDKTGEGAMIEIISKNGKKIDKFSDATEWEILFKSKSKFKLKGVDPNFIENLDDVAIDGAVPIKFKLFILEEL